MKSRVVKSGGKFIRTGRNRVLWVEGGVFPVLPERLPEGDAFEYWPTDIFSDGLDISEDFFIFGKGKK